MKIKKIIAMLSASALCIALTSCGKKIVNYTCDDYIDIDLSGVSGNAEANVKFDRDLIDKINMDVYEGKADDVQLAQLEVYLYSAVEYDIVGETKELSNGDVITVVLSPDNERLKDIGISFSETEYSYTVSGLTEPVTLDLFKDVEVTFEGVSPYLKANYEYVGDNEFIKENVSYFLDGANSCKNGDTLTLKARYNRNVFDANNYVAEADETEILVEGCREYVNADADFTVVREYLENYVHELFEKEDTPYRLDCEYDARSLIKDGSPFEKWKVVKSEITPEKIIAYTDKPDYLYLDIDISGCSYNIFWKVSMDIEKTRTTLGYSDTGYEIGDKEHSDIYICTYAYRIVREPDGTITFDENNVGNIIYDNKKYIGCTLDEIIAVRDEDKSRYDKTELVE